MQAVVVCVRGTVESATPYAVRGAMAIVGAEATIGSVAVGRRVAREGVAKHQTIISLAY